ncbi:DUF4328 domain-containing protein [Kineococcus sp. LSe6-4]|uniref:DUF4328 domain-containing protein n=1 Tax=Kineococcus halophytocola TaxID=3234027 RepID=A0ABV4GWP1_9ACTN
MTDPSQDDRWDAAGGGQQPHAGDARPPSGPPSFDKGPSGPAPFPPSPHPDPHPSQSRYPPQGQYPPQGRYPPYPDRYSSAGLRPVGALSTAAVVLAAVVTGGELLSGLTGFGYSPDALWTAYDTVTVVTGLAWLASFIVTGIWLTRVRRNAELLAPAFHHQRAWGWAWAGWVVPVVSLWFPFQVVRDAVTASASTANPAAPHSPRPAFGLWWGTWLAGMVLTNAAGQQPIVNAAAGGVTIGGLHLLGAVCLVVSLTAWIRIVRTARSLQQAAG